MFFILGAILSAIGIINLPSETYWGEILSVGGLLIGSGFLGKYILLIKEIN